MTKQEVIEAIKNGTGNSAENDLPNFMLESDLINYHEPIDEFVTKNIKNFKKTLN